MGSIAGSKKLKRQMAPTFWGINRKEKRFVITVRPGAHPKNNSIPTAVLLRDTLKKVKTLREAKSSIYGGKVKVDGVIQKSLHHSIGLMDVIELEGITDVYRLVPYNGHLLEPIKINVVEKSKKLVKVKSKTTSKGGKTQLGFHDGRTIITDTNVNIDDTCILQIPDQKILDVIKFEKNSQVIVTRGINAGRVGLINKIKQGTFTLPKRINLLIDDKTIEIPANITMVVGKEKPVIQIM
uniref:Small ribosomal subunit protein eS4 n=1 Tax=uncultured marine thaumarchaeote KM3_71_C08 TaxID=1456257 RepID=A0A075HKA2_9ARCH|nr:ribosomal protein S4e (RP-S4e, RPS4) [uncultured marine thaumarchaeote KM3_71_C08]